MGELTFGEGNKNLVGRSAGGIFPEEGGVEQIFG